MLLITLRAGFFMVFLPWMGWLLSRAFLPAWSIPAPGIGGMGLEHIVTFVVFVFGAAIWMTNPSGRGAGADFSGGSDGGAGGWSDYGGDGGGDGGGD